MGHKLSKTTEKHNSFQFYIREEFKPIYGRFEELVEEDKDFKGLEIKKGSGVKSIAITSFIFNYVAKKDPNFIKNWQNLQNLSKEPKEVKENVNANP